MERLSNSEQRIAISIVKFRNLEMPWKKSLRVLSAVTYHLLRCGQSKSRERSHRRIAYQSRLGTRRQENGYFTDNGKPLWVVGFPMFEYDRKQYRYRCRTQSVYCAKASHEDLMVSDPANCFWHVPDDMVLNGWEIGGDSIRIHRADAQEKVLPALKISPEEQQEKFSFLLNNPEIQCASSRRPCIRPRPFGYPDDKLPNPSATWLPSRKTQRAQCLLTNARPTAWTTSRCAELRSRLRQKAAETKEE